MQPGRRLCLGCIVQTCEISSCGSTRRQTLCSINSSIAVMTSMLTWPLLLLIRLCGFGGHIVNHVRSHCTGKASHLLKVARAIPTFLDSGGHHSSRSITVELGLPIGARPLAQIHHLYLVIHSGLPQPRIHPQQSTIAPMGGPATSRCQCEKTRSDE